MQSRVKSFASLLDAAHLLRIEAQGDGDIILNTLSLCSDDPPAIVRVRTGLGGGRYPEFTKILTKMCNLKTYDRHQPSLFSGHVMRDARKRPKVFEFGCDDNPGSGYRFYFNVAAIGIQTRCFDPDANDRAGSGATWPVEGPVIWIDRADLPDIHARLEKKAFLYTQAHNKTLQKAERGYEL